MTQFELTPSRINYCSLEGTCRWIRRNWWVHPWIILTAYKSNFCFTYQFYCNLDINWVKSYSSSYCLCSHNSGKESRTALIPLLDPDDAPEPSFPLPGLFEKRSNSCSVPIVSNLLFSPLITVLAVWTLNFCNLFKDFVRKMNWNYLFLMPYPIIFSSSVDLVIRRYTLTTFFWPIRCARSMACKSFIGFQSCSTKITVSAPVRFKPKPPTCVVSKRTSIEGSLLNLKQE